MTDTYLPARAYDTLVNDLTRILSHDHDSADVRQAAIAAALATAGFTSPAVVQIVAAAEPCAFSGEYEERDVRMMLGTACVWPENMRGELQANDSARAAFAEAVDDYRQGTIDADELRRRIADAVKADPGLQAFKKIHLAWTDHDDTIEWSQI